jgi:hypothetical protein
VQLLEKGPGVQIQKEITLPEIRATILPCALGFLQTVEDRSTESKFRGVPVFVGNGSSKKLLIQQMMHSTRESVATCGCKFQLIYTLDL